jgi:hypothetical protein
MALFILNLITAKFLFLPALELAVCLARLSLVVAFGHAIFSCLVSTIVRRFSTPNAHLKTPAPSVNTPVLVIICKTSTKVIYAATVAGVVLCCSINASMTGHTLLKSNVAMSMSLTEVSMMVLTMSILASIGLFGNAVSTLANNATISGNS